MKQNKYVERWHSSNAAKKALAQQSLRSPVVDHFLCGTKEIATKGKAYCRGVSRAFKGWTGDCKGG